MEHPPHPAFLNSGIQCMSLELQRRPFAITRLLIAAAVLLLALAGCATTDLAPAASIERAEAYAARGEHAAAAREFDAVAATAADAFGNPWHLAAARQWLLAAQPARAAAALQRIVLPLDEAATARRDRLAAEIALAEGSVTRAWQLIQGVSASPAAADREEYFELRQRIALANRLPLEAIRSAGERERGEVDANRVATLRSELLDALRNAIDQGLVIDPREAARDVVARGWLEAASLAARTARAPASANPGLTASWRSRYPNHPARAALAATHAESVTRLLAEKRTAEPPTSAVTGKASPPSATLAPRPSATVSGGHVAALLPLTGPRANDGTAVQAGLIAAYRSSNSDLPLRFYDSAAEPVDELVKRARAAGADFIIGPLAREETQTLANLATFDTPLLALAALPETLSAATPTWVQFDLSPEAEAKAAAQAALAANHRRAILLLPGGEWGERIGAAFRNELEAGGGQVIGSHELSGDVGATIETALRLDQSRARHRRLQSVLDLPLAFQARRRADVELLFAPGSASHLRELRPRLKFHGASDLPTYSTALAWDGRRSSELDGLLFADMPWMLQPRSGIASNLQDLLDRSADTSYLDSRSFALGHDAWLLQTAIRRAITAGQSLEQVVLSGATGQLSIDAERRVQRALVQASISDGIATATP